MLRVDGLRVAYGPVTALAGVSFEVADGSITAVLGANGAGKTSLLRTISGLVRARSGSIVFDGREIGGAAAEDIARLGIAHVPEGRGVITELTVEENLRLGGLWRRADDGDRIYALFPALRERRAKPAGTLSGGERQMLVIGRALMARPRLLLLDEPSMGLAPILVDRIFEIIVEINKQGTTVLVVEQNASIALSVANRGYVLETGEIKLADDAAALRSNDEVRKLYLGEI
jgi:branched-chain amino acid transport system ATP-binding protein